MAKLYLVRALLGSFVALFLADKILTYIAVGHGARELSPLGVWLLSHGPVVYAFVMLLLIVVPSSLIWWLHRRFTKPVLAVLVFLNSIYLAVVVNNAIALAVLV